MGKIFLSLTVFLLFFTIIIPLNSQQHPTEGIINEKIAPVYENPDVNSKKLRSLSTNIEVKILNSQKGWYFVEVRGKTGWIEQKYVNISKSELSDEHQEIEKPDIADRTESPSVKKEESERTSLNKPDVYKTWSYGIKAGLNIAKVNGKDVADKATSRNGFNAGALISYKFNNFIAIQPEILYSQKGFIEGDSTSKLDYLSIPFLLKIYYNSGAYTSYIALGPEISYKINSALVTPKKTYKYDDIKKTDIGIIIGAGLGYYINENTEIVFDARYVLGFSTVHDNTIHNKEELEIINNNISFSIGINF